MCHLVEIPLEYLRGQEGKTKRSSVSWHREQKRQAFVTEFSTTESTICPLGPNLAKDSPTKSEKIELCPQICSLKMNQNYL